MATLRTATPSPPPSGIRTPPTPKHGYSDPWEPYSPRKSTRLSSRRAANRTPSPSSSHRTPPRTTRKSAAASNAAIMSPTATPQKKRMPVADSVRRASGALTVEGTANAASALGLEPQLPQEKEESRESRRAAMARRTGMLPTPVKTPKKAPTETQTASIQAVARSLFSTEETPQSARRKRSPKKYTGISMDSFRAEEVEDPIQIFTDSHDRVPAVDNSAENPFYGNSTTRPEPRLRRSKRNVVVPGEGTQNVEDALQREDGLVYVFRGKKVFRKFAVDEDGEEDGASGSRAPLTRSSIKPRRLFQAPEEVTPEDEEAVTDIEDNHAEQAEEVVETPLVKDSCPATPSAPRFGAEPMTPDTRRTTRFGTKTDDATPSKPKSKARGPFDEWRRVKSSADQATKRSAEEPLASSSASKRARI